MEGDSVIYLDRRVLRQGFRVFVYRPGGVEKIAESYDEFEKLMSTGDWFATKADAEASIAVANKKAKK